MNDEYISRKKAVETIQYRVCQGYGKIEHICQRGSCAYCGIMEVMSDISSIEAADVQPVKSGHWEKLTIVPATETGNRILARCSECGDTVFYTVTGREITLKYCPNCGARLDGDTVLHDRCSNYMDCDGSCFIDDTPCDCGGNIEKCKGR